MNHDTPYEQWLHRNLLFAGKVLAENVPVTDSKLASEIIAKLMALEGSDSPLVGEGLRDRIFRIISSLYETAFEPIALELLQNQEKIGLWRFLRYQGELAPNQAEQKLLTLLHDDDWHVRANAVDMLVNLGRGSEAIVSNLIELLRNDNNVSVRSKTARALGKLGQNSHAVINNLVVVLQDANPSVRANSIEALGNIRHGSDVVVNGLHKVLGNKSYSWTWPLAAKVLADLNQDPETIVNALLKLLQDDELLVRSDAARALGHIGYLSIVPQKIGSEPQF